MKSTTATSAIALMAMFHASATAQNAATGPVPCTGDADCYFAAVNAANASGGHASDFLDVCDYHFCNEGICDSCERQFAHTLPAWTGSINSVDLICAANGFINYCLCPSADVWDTQSPDNKGPSGIPIGADDLLAIVNSLGGFNPFDCGFPASEESCAIIAPPVDSSGTLNIDCQAECQSNTDCDDSSFCNGNEMCVGGRCRVGTRPCSNLVCDEIGQQCVPCVDNGDCDDNLFCNGMESCNGSGLCVPGDNPCIQGIACDEANDLCTGTRRIFLVPAGMDPADTTPGQNIEINPTPGSVMQVEVYMRDPTQLTRGFEFAIGCEYVSLGKGAPGISFVPGSMNIDIFRPDYFLLNRPSFPLVDEGQCNPDIACTSNADCLEGNAFCGTDGQCGVTPPRAGAIQTNPNSTTSSTSYIGDFEIKFASTELVGNYVIRPICTDADHCFKPLTSLFDFVDVEPLPFIVDGLEINRATICCDASSMSCENDILQTECNAPRVWRFGRSCGIDDCNSNGFVDSCDIATGISNDCNVNDIPDECEAFTCTQDCDCYMAATTGEPDICNPADVLDVCDYHYCDIPDGELEGTCTTCQRRYGNTCAPYGGVVQTSDILCAIAGFGNYCACPNADLVSPGSLPGPSGTPIGTDDILAAIAAFGGANPLNCPAPTKNTCDDNPPPTSDGCTTTAAPSLTPPNRE